MLHVLLAALAAEALSAPAAPPPGAPEHPHRDLRAQVFIAPSGEPFRAARDEPYPVAAWFARADANHDGRLTEAEFTADFVAFCASLDINHDGVIDADEIDRYETQIAPEVHAADFGGGGTRPEGGAKGEGGGRRGGRHGGGMGGGGEGGAEGRGRGGGHRGGDEGGGSAPSGSAGNSYGNRPQGAGRFDMLGLPEPVSAMDTDFRARISRREVLDAAGYRFGVLDVQHHGYLTLADLPETPAQARHKAFRERREGQGRGHDGDRHD